MAALAALFDTNILIDYTRGIPEALHEITRFPERAISIITWMEVLAGEASENEIATRRFLSSFSIYPVSQEISEQAIIYRRLLRLKLPDAIILATAEIHNLQLITRNTRDFPVNSSRVHVPYKI